MMDQFERDGLALSYRETGEGLPVIFQHGLGGDEAQIADIYPEEPPTRRITLECRGQGASPLGSAETISVATFADDVLALADRLGLDRFVLGGMSMGAAISLRIAVRHPDRVTALVLARPAWLAGSAPQNMEPFAEVGELLLRYPPDEARRRFDRSDRAAELARDAPDNLASLRGFFDRRNPEATARLLIAIARDGPGVSEVQIGRIEVPTLVIGHGEDLIHPLAYAETLAGMIHGAELRVIPSKVTDLDGYFREFRGAIGEFLAGLPSRHGSVRLPLS